MAGKQTIDVQDKDTLLWPDGWQRTRIESRRPQNAWKGTRAKYRDALVKELEMIGATSMLVTHAPNERLDPGVSIWFSRRKEDYSWQEGLGIDSPAPTLEEIDKTYREKAKNCHPDRTDGGDPELFKQLGEHRKNARAWVMGTHDSRHEYVLACDKYKEIRLNMAALRLAFSSFRSLERVGVPAILERTLDKAFKAALPMHAGGGQ